MTPQEQSKRHFGHGLTVGEMEAIRDKQAGKDLTPFKYFKPNRLHEIKDRFVQTEFGDYQVVEHEINVYHVYQEARLFNQSTGEKLSTGSVQTYTQQTFKELEKAKAFKAFTHVIILHDPTIKEEVKAPSAPTGGESADSFGSQPLAWSEGNAKSMTIEKAKEEYKAKFGRLPHHSWTVDTILKKMEESNQ